MRHRLGLAHPCIRFAAAPMLAGARGDHACLHHGGSLAVRRIRAQVLRRQPGHVHMQVDAVQQRTGNAAAVPPDEIGAAAAPPAGIAGPPSSAQVTVGDGLMNYPPYFQGVLQTLEMSILAARAMDITAA